MIPFEINQENIKKVQTQGFLESIDHMQIKEQWVRLSILDNNDEVVKYPKTDVPAVLEGCATAGSISINGSSAIRRSGSLTLVTYDGTEPYFDQRFLINKVSQIDNLISINKRVKIEIKLANRGIKFDYRETENSPIETLMPDYFIFPLGIFVVKSANVSYSTSGLQISLTLGDKMCLLNGECGGTIQTAVTYSPAGYINDKGEIVNEKVRFDDLVHTFVEQIAGITTEVIIDPKLSEKIPNLVRWGKESPIYLDKIEGTNQYELTTIQKQGTVTYKYNDTIGIQYTDYVYPGDLTSNAGDSVVTMLDKLKNTLGNWEYFFDVDGVFHFQEIQNFINEGSELDDWAKAISDQYLIQFDDSKVKYHFDDGTLISAYNNSPQYLKVKNDIVVWGQRSDNKLGIRYHLIIDTKPTLSGSGYQVEWYIDSLGVIRAKSIGDRGTEWITPADWRQELYFKAIQEETAYQADRTNVGTIPYMLRQEIIEEFPKIYNILFNKTDDGTGFYYKPSESSWYLDYLDPAAITSDAQVKDFSVESIGRRTANITDNNVNCLLPPQSYNILFIEKMSDWTVEMQEIYDGYVLVGDWADSLSLGAAYNSAYDLLRSAIHEYTSYQNSVSLTTIPIYHLEPNTRISINDDTSDIHGHYMIQTISIPLATSGMMNITATEALERI